MATQQKIGAFLNQVVTTIAYPFYPAPRAHEVIPILTDGLTSRQLFTVFPEQESRMTGDLYKRGYCYNKTNRLLGNLTSRQLNSESQMASLDPT